MKIATVSPTLQLVPTSYKWTTQHLPQLHTPFSWVQHCSEETKAKKLRSIRRRLPKWWSNSDGTAMTYHWRCTRRCTRHPDDAHTGALDTLTMYTHRCTRRPPVCTMQYSFNIPSVQLTAKTLVASKCYHAFGWVKVSTALLIKIAVFLDTTFWWHVICYTSFGGSRSLHFQTSLLRLPQRWKQRSSPAKSGTSYQSTQHQKQDCNLINP